MKIRSAKKLMAIFFSLCMVLSFVPITTFAAEGDIDITEVNLNGVSNELWAFEDVPFATVDENSNYTIEEQEWLSETNRITPNSENLKPTAEGNYTFNITLKAKDGYVFPRKSPEANVFYGGVFKVNGNECDGAVITVTSDKTIRAILFTNTKVKGVTDIPPGNTEVKTSVRDNYADCEVTEDINLKKDSDYIIDFTKEDNLSMALRAMADLEGTKYYKFANSDNNSLVKTENTSEALIKMVGNKAENKAVMTLVSDIDTSTSYTLKFVRTHYTGSKLTYTGTTRDEQTGKNTIYETRDDYYTRYHFNCKLNLIAAPIHYEIIEGMNSSWEQNNDTLTFRANGDFSKFVGIKVDDSWVDEENYESTSGSTIVTLKNEYLKTLSTDKHKLTFVYTDGECSTNFDIKKLEESQENSNNAEMVKSGNNSNNPQTGDNSNMLLWTFLFSTSSAGLLGIAVYNRKKEYTV